MPRALLTAILRSASGKIDIDSDKGIIRGVKLMELGKLARFAGEDGKAKQVKITDAHISALLNHAGNRALPIHFTHEWHLAEQEKRPDADSIEMGARIGALKSFRRDDNGNLVADAHLNKSKPAALDLLWGAESNPEDNCFSVVFSYLKDDPECIPQNFRAGDVVPSGAATTALFKEDQTQDKANSMTPEELCTMLDDPKIKSMIEGMIKGHTKATKEPDGDEEAAAKMEQDPALMSEFQITDADKRDGDKTLTACMRLKLQSTRAIARLSKQLATDKATIIAESKVAVKAEMTALFGKNGFHNSTGDGNTADALTAKLATYKEAAKGNEVLAVSRMLKDYPELGPQWEEQQRLRCARLSGRVAA